MKIRTLSFLAVAALVSLTACGGGDEAEGGDTQTTADTMVTPGTDTVSQPAVVPTQDTTIIEQTTTTDTTVKQGDATDTTVADTTQP